LHTGDDAVVFTRESLDETVLVHVARAAHGPVILAADALAGATSATLLHGDHDLVLNPRDPTLGSEGPTIEIWRLER
jgi:alpha-glucosidase